MKVEPIKHKDVRGKELFYIKFSTEDGSVEMLMNVGEKSHNAVMAIINVEKEKKHEKTK